MKRFIKKLPVWILVFICFFVVAFHAEAGEYQVNQLLSETGMNTDFRDVASDNDNTIFIKYLINRGLVRGFPDGTFRPEKGVTRAELTVLANKILGVTGKSKSIKFKDVKSDHWAAQCIADMSKAGLISGYPDGTFRPDRIVTRAEGISLLLRLNQGAASEIKQPQLDDLNHGHWAAKEVAVGLESKMINTLEKNHFVPDGPLSRGDLARALSVLLVKDPELSRENLPNQIKVLKGDISVTSSNGIVINDIKEGFSVREGDRITTGKNGTAELIFPDGSGILIKENTQLVVREFQGRSYIKPDASPGIAVEWLDLQLEVGKIFGTLATPLYYDNDDTDYGTGSFKAAKVKKEPQKIQTISNKKQVSANKKVPWWKINTNKRVRVKVDMPWSVATVRGTFWENVVYPEKYNRTNVLVGEAEVASGNNSVLLTAGLKSEVRIPGTPPVSKAMNESDKNDWLEVKDWAENRAREIQENREGVILVSLPVPSVPAEPDSVVSNINAVFNNVTSGTTSGGSGGGGSTPDTSPPVIASTSPLSGGVGVSQNSLIEVNFNETVVSGELFNDITVSDGISIITVSKAISNSRLTIIPSGPLLYSTTYTVMIPAQAVSDIKGNMFQGEYSFSFTTGGPTTVASTTPANNALDVALNTPIEVNFNEPVQQGTAFDSISMTDGVTPLTITTSISGSKLSIIPSGGLNYSKTYTVTVPAQAVKNTAQNGLGSDYSFSFTTGGLTTVASTTPANNASDVPLNTVIEINFNDSVQQGTAFDNISMTDGITPITITKSISGSKLSITPSGDLDYSKTYTVTVPAQAVKNTAQNGLGSDYSFSFTTGGLTTVASTTPANNASDVPLNTAIEINFNEPVQQGTAFDNISVTDGITPITITKSISGSKLSITPSGDSDYSKTYTVTVPAQAVKNTAQNGLDSDYSFSFTTGGLTTVASTTPANNASDVPLNTPIEVNFNESVHQGTAFDNISVIDGVTPLAITSSISGSKLSITTVEGFVYNKTYTVSIPAQAVKNTAQNGLESDYSFSFTTGGITTVLSTTPANNASDIPWNTPIEVNFNESVQQGTAFDNISMTDGIIPITITKSISGSKLSITPSGDLDYSKTYTVTVPVQAVKNTAQNGLESDYSFSFTTGGITTVVSTTPANNASDIPLNTPIEVNFNESVQQGTVFDNISVIDGVTPLAITSSLSGSKLTITTVDGFVYNKTYTVSIPAQAVKNTAQNGLESDYSFSFATGGLTTVASTTPVNNASDVPLNTAIEINFNEPVQQGAAFDNISMTDGGAPLAITTGLSNQTLSISPSDGLDYDKTYTVTVPALAIRNTAENGMGLDYSFSFTTRKLISFQTPDNYGVETNPKGVVAGDFISDRSVDLAVIYESSQNITILKGLGDGKFVAGAVYSTVQLPTKIAVGDFNGDNKSDLATINSSSLENVEILLGNDSGGFVDSGIFKAGESLTGMVVDDFNKDGLSDLAVTDYYYSIDEFLYVGAVRVLTGNADGTFTMSEVFTSYNSFNSIMAQDFNNDSLPDLAVGNDDAGSTVTVLLNNGDGTFGAQAPTIINMSLKGLAGGYFDSDAFADIAALHFAHDNNVTTLFGLGDGTTVAGSVYSAGSYPNGLVTADLNRDDKYDIAVVSGSGMGQDISIFLGNGDGTFQDPPVYLTAGSSPQAIIAIDVNGDSVNDLVMVNYGSDNISILLNNT